MILVDSCVLIDVFDADPQWQQWSLDALQAHHAQGLAVNALICAEIAPSFESVQGMQTALDLAHLVYAPLSQTVAFLAAQAFTLYRRNRGSKSTTLPDFFIGAHAQSQGWAILTRDKVRYKTYFPAVTLITPETLR